MERALLVALALIAPAAHACQCDSGTYWCDAQDNNRHEFNCSGTVAARALWKNISEAEAPSASDCQALRTTCDARQGAHGVDSGNATCDDGCYDFCWKRDVGDCADMDDDQSFCVGQCMDYCTAKRECFSNKRIWDPCQSSCIAKHMEGQRGPNFVDYANCMAECSPVPVSPYGGLQAPKSFKEFECTDSEGEKKCKAIGGNCCRDPGGEPDSMCLNKPCAFAAVMDGMNVTTVNMVGCTVNLRSVDPASGKYGPAFCTMTNGSSCSAAQDFIAVVADGTGRYDAGDPFDAWWGDDSWRTAVQTLELHQGSNPEYIEYVKPK